MSGRVTFEIDGPPVPWQRSRQNGKLHFISKEQAAARKVVAVLCKAAMRGQPIFDGPLRMDILAVWQWPKSFSEKRRKTAGEFHKISRPDSDNVSKLICDALNEVAYQDDAQVVELHVLKQFGPRAFTRVTIEQIYEQIYGS